MGRARDFEQEYDVLPGQHDCGPDFVRLSGLRFEFRGEFSTLEPSHRQSQVAEKGPALHGDWLRMQQREGRFLTAPLPFLPNLTRTGGAACKAAHPGYSPAGGLSWPALPFSYP